MYIYLYFSTCIILYVYTLEVLGSLLICRGVAQPGRAHASEAWGHWFESNPLDQPSGCKSSVLYRHKRIRRENDALGQIGRNYSVATATPILANII